MTDALLVERADGVATLTLNRPDSLNSLDTPTKEALRDTLANLAADQDVRAVVLTGAGRAFCVGQDLREHVESLETGMGASLSTVREHYNPIASLIVEMPKPVIAAVRGMAAFAEPIDATTANRLGLLTQLVDDDEQVLPTAVALAKRLAAGPTFAYGQIKRQLAASGTLAEILELEAEAQAACGQTTDHHQATAAFVRKEKPTFTGR